MSPKVSVSGFSPFLRAAGIVALSAFVASSQSLAQTPPGSTTSIRRDSDQARQMREPSFQTREERLNAMPLDWNSTIGTPRTEERGVNEGQTSAGGAPDPRADEEARRLHPDDWK
jgi:hypothetical protein